MVPTLAYRTLTQIGGIYYRYSTVFKQTTQSLRKYDRMCKNYVIYRGTRSMVLKEVKIMGEGRREPTTGDAGEGQEAPVEAIISLTTK